MAVRCSRTLVYSTRIRSSYLVLRIHVSLVPPPCIASFADVDRNSSLLYFASFHLPGNPTWVVYTWLGSAVAADVVITISIIFYLRQSKNRAVETDDVLQKIERIVLETNSLTGVMAIIHAVLFATLSTTYHVIANCEFSTNRCCSAQRID